MARARPQSPAAARTPVRASAPAAAPLAPAHGSAPIVDSPGAASPAGADCAAFQAASASYSHAMT
jgi:hypothetical protein